MYLAEKRDVRDVIIEFVNQWRNIASCRYVGVLESALTSIHRTQL